MDSQRLKLVLGYDGTAFHGWAEQPGLRTVQTELQAAIDTLLRRPAGTTRLTVGGRTDAGVHARGQVAHFDVTGEEYAKLLGRATGSEAELAYARARKINGVLHRAGVNDVAVSAVTPAPQEFDARFGAIHRRYEYRLKHGYIDPLQRFYTAQVKRPIDFAVLQRVSGELTGLRDFTTFCKAREGATAVRNLTHFEWQQLADGTCVARIQADAFCHSMVRALVGGAVAAATGRIRPAELAELADLRERSTRFAVMPALGLSLEEIAYPPDEELAARAQQTRAKREAV